jgi:hypothetical protein
MIDKNEQDPRPEQDRILRAKDIIPGAERAVSPDEESGATKFDIPRFNLAQDILSAQRRQSAVRRKGPTAEEGRQKTKDRGQRTEDPASLRFAGANRIETLRDSIIAEIVARDIERLCCK